MIIKATARCSFGQRGPHEYLIDFNNMCQNGNMRIRKIMRKTFMNQDEKEIFDKNVRGIIGIYFEKK